MYRKIPNVEPVKARTKLHISYISLQDKCIHTFTRADDAKFTLRKYAYKWQYVYKKIIFQ